MSNQSRQVVFTLEVNNKILEQETISIPMCYDHTVKCHLEDWAFTKVALKWIDLSHARNTFITKRAMFFSIEHGEDLIAAETVWIPEYSLVLMELKDWAKGLMLLYWKNQSATTDSR